MFVFVVFASGLIIFGYNYILGKDFSKSPQFDLSMYDNVEVVDPAVVDKLMKSMDPQITAILEDKEPEKINQALVDELKNKIEQAAALKKQSLYFSTYFQAETPEATKKMIDNFTQDFPILKNAPYEDLAALNCFVVVLPVENRASLVKTLEKQVFDQSFNVLEAPNYSGCFKTPKYYEAIVAILKNYPELKWLTTAPTIKYSVRLDVSGIIKEHLEEIKKISTEYADVIKFIE